jgi:hypothetical protein
MKEIKNKDQDKFEPMGTKIDPAMAVVWNAVCQALGTDTYHLLQQFIYAMIRMASDAHAKTPEVEKLMTLLDSDAAWQNAINLCAPNGQQKISQMILIVEDDEKHGFGVHMLDKPFIGHCKQTENVDLIMKRLAEVVYRREYTKMCQLAKRMGIKSLRQLLSIMIDTQTESLLDNEFRDELPNIGDRTDSGRVAGDNAYGKRTKQTKRKTPDNFSRELNIFDNHRNIDAELSRGDVDYD